MKRLFFWFWLLIKRQMKSAAMPAFLIGMPLVCFVIAQIPAMHEQGSVRVALYAADDDRVAADTIKQLTSGDYTADFYVAADLQQMEKDIREGRADHGYYFKEGFKARLDGKQYKGSICLLRKSAGMTDAMTREIVFSEMFRAYALDIAQDYICEEAVFAQIKEEALEAVRTGYADYKESNDTFHIDFGVVDGSGSVTQAKEAGVDFPIRGVLAVLVFVAGLYGGVWWLSDQKEGVFLAMPRYLARASRFLYISVPTLLFAVSVEFTLWLTDTGDFPAELAAMAAYAASIIVFTGFLTMLIKNNRLLAAAIPVFAIASLVLCPVFVNLTSVVPAVKYMCRMLLPYYYIVH